MSQQTEPKSVASWLGGIAMWGIGVGLFCLGCGGAALLGFGTGS